MASAAASFISSLISRARTSSTPRKRPGKQSTLLIWFGKSVRPVAMTATCGAASSGRISGSGLAIAKTMGSRFIFLMSSTVIMFGPATPRNRSAPSIASLTEPLTPSRFVFSANHSFMKFMPSVRPL